MSKFKVGQRVLVTSKFPRNDGLNKYEGVVGIDEVYEDYAKVIFVENCDLKARYFWFEELLPTGNLSESLYG